MELDDTQFFLSLNLPYFEDNAYNAVFAPYSPFMLYS